MLINRQCLPEQGANSRPVISKRMMSHNRVVEFGVASAALWHALISGRVHGQPVTRNQPT